jgi:uncharacterized Zn-binding protein involved in type VI secretion
LGGHWPSPTTPADLAAANAGGAAIRLTWAASKDDTTPQASIVYEICQTTTSGGCSGGSFSVTYSVTGQTKYTTGTLTNGTTYFFTIRAKDTAENTSAVSPQVRATAVSAPTWQQTAYLKAPNTGANDNFGRSVAISGDTIVVGAYYEDSNSTAVCNATFTGNCAAPSGTYMGNNSTTDAGAAYVFERDGSGAWQQKAYLKAPNTEMNDQYGLSVAISGDTIVVGAYYEDSNSTAVCNEPLGSCGGLSNNSDPDAGAAYVFERDGSGAWQQKAYLKAPNAGVNDWFGFSVAISGDTIVVGAYQEDSNSTAVCNNLGSCPGMSNNSTSDFGAAYVFERDGSGAWQQKAYLKAPNAEGSDYFGQSVAISGDTIVVGANLEDSNSTAVCNNLGSCGGLSNNSATDAGAAYVFERDGSGAWQQKAYLKAPNTGPDDRLGRSVAISGDTIVVGARQEDSSSTAVMNFPFGSFSEGATDAGAAYVFERDGSGAWQQKAYLKAPNAGVNDWFGYSVAISGDTIVVGADYEDSNSTVVCNAPFSGSCAAPSGTYMIDNTATDAGAAYVFERK